MPCVHMQYVAWTNSVLASLLRPTDQIGGTSLWVQSLERWLVHPAPQGLSPIVHDMASHYDHRCPGLYGVWAKPRRIS